MGKRYTGYTSKTMENRATGAGAYFKGYDPTKDTFTTAVQAGKLIGATQGGGSFTAKANMRPIEVDGVPGNVMGMQEIDNWDVTMTANVIEVTADTIKLSLGAATISESEAPVHYKKITGKNTISIEDYQDNITFIGTVSGFDNPIIIQVFNALSTEGLTYQSKDKGETVIPMSFTGHYDAESLDNPPFAIWIPVKEEKNEEINI